MNRVSKNHIPQKNNSLRRFINSLKYGTQSKTLQSRILSKPLPKTPKQKENFYALSARAKRTTSSQPFRVTKRKYVLTNFTDFATFSEPGETNGVKKVNQDSHCSKNLNFFKIEEVDGVKKITRNHN